MPSGNCNSETPAVVPVKSRLSRSAAASEDKPALIEIRIRVVPDQPVSVHWDAICVTGSSGASKSGNETLNDLEDVTLGDLPTAPPTGLADSCTFGASASLDSGSGWVQVKIVDVAR